MNLDTFLSLPTDVIARLVREQGPKVAVFPINGTRRWFLLEYPEQATHNFMEAYFQLGGERHIELYKLFFDHGVDTLLTPIFGPDLLERGEDYQQMMVPALLWVAQDPAFLNFYDAYDVRVRIYGDTQRYFKGTPYEPAIEVFEALAERTVSHRRHRLFFGVCAHDAAETVAEIGVQFQHDHNRLPSKHEIVEAYYGEYVDPVSFFIGFDRPSAFDMPLVSTGSEDLYFTVSPSPYLDAQALRLILFDHLYTRRVDEADYALSDDEWETLRHFYHLNHHHVLGLGQRYQQSNIWHPTPQVELMPAMEVPDTEDKV
ncbi:MAG: diterpene synthase [Anaerolineae bacterium]|jgi:tuberculosinol/isotuberculosinol synthase|nr:diterpene synthase [Anaerolineae bacterium]